MRKISYSILMAVAVLSLVFVGCKKDSDVVTLKCHIEKSDAKGYIDGDRYPSFYTSTSDYSENVNVNGAVYVIAPASNHSFDIADVVSADNYYAIYPSAIVTTAAACTTNSVSVTLPYTQSYRVKDGNQIVDLPMGAVSTDQDNVNFYNLCSVLEVQCTNTTGSAFAISSIEVKVEGVGLAGVGTATINGTNSQISIPATDINQKIVFEIPPANRVEVANNSMSPAYRIVLPPFSGKILIKVRTDDGKKSASKTNTSFTLNRNTLYTLTYAIGELDEKQDNELSGYFSISRNMKVVFSKGNLQADRPTGTGTWGWKFADQQYDFYGGNNRTSTFDGGVSPYKRDLFSWSNPYTNYGLDDIPDDEELDDPTFNDWGDHHIQGDPEGQTPWFTLSYAEWAYLIGSDGTNMNANWPCRTNAVMLRSRAKINGISNHSSGSSVSSVYGFLIFPDNWTTPYGITLYHHDTLNEIDLATWSRLEAAGAMFLPAAGMTDTYFQVQKTYEEGYYWSCTPTTRYGDEAYDLMYKYSNQYANMAWQVGQSTYVRYSNAHSVRLVKPAPGYSMANRGAQIPRVETNK